MGAYSGEQYGIHKALIPKMVSSDKETNTFFVKTKMVSDLLVGFLDLYPRVQPLEFLEQKKDILDTLGLSVSLVDETLKAVLGLDKQIEGESRTIFEELLEARDVESGCWKFLQDGQASNPWITATCLFAMHKASILKFLPYKSIETHAEAAVVWLTKTAYLSGGGWNNVPPEFNNDMSEPLLRDTCYVLGILARIEEVSIPTDILKDVLSFILEQRNNKSESSVWVDNGRIDHICTSYALRCLLNCYMHRLKELRLAQLDTAVQSAIDEGIEYLLASQNNDGSWSETPADTHGSVRATAIALQTLRKYGYKREDYWISAGCFWLISQLEYCDNTWCWTTWSKEERRTVPGVEETAVAVSALLIGSCLMEFSNVRVVLRWLLSQRTSYHDNIYIAYILCALLDYLRAIHLESDFFGG